MSNNALRASSWRQLGIDAIISIGGSSAMDFVLP